MDASVGTLLVLGAVSVVAAIVGGNVKLPGGTEFGPLGKPLVRVLLFSAGGFFFLIALGLSASQSKSGDSADPELSRDEYAKNVVPICQRWQKEIGQLEAPPDGAFDSMEALADFYGNAGNMVQSWAAEMKSAPAPAGDTVALSRIYNHLHAIGSEMLEMASGAVADDQEVTGEAARQAEARMRQYNTASESYGLDARCQYGS